MRPIFWNSGEGLIYYAWQGIGDLLGGPATVILATLFLWAMIRVVVGFVLRLFRFRDTYNVKISNWKKTSADDIVRDIPPVE